MTGEEQVRFFKEDDIMAMEITNNYSNVEQANAEKEMQAKASSLRDIRAIIVDAVKKVVK